MFALLAGHAGSIFCFGLLLASINKSFEMSVKYNTPATAFERKEYDASINICCWICFCPWTLGFLPYKTILTLDSEEVTRTDV